MCPLAQMRQNKNKLHFKCIVAFHFHLIRTRENSTRGIIRVFLSMKNCLKSIGKSFVHKLFGNYHRVFGLSSYNSLLFNSINDQRRRSNRRKMGKRMNEKWIEGKMGGVRKAI